MNTTNVSSLDRTFQKTKEWIDELVEIGGYQSEQQAYTALRAVLHAVRDRLTAEEAADFASQLPMLVRGFYWEGWRPGRAPNRAREADEFVGKVEHSRRNAQGGIDAAAAVEHVFTLLERKITEGQLEDVRHMLPREIAGLTTGR